MRGEEIIVIPYAAYDGEELSSRVVHVDAHNQILAVDEHVDILLS
jgi:aspartate 1-decarboxylase